MQPDGEGLMLFFEAAMPFRFWKDVTLSKLGSLSFNMAVCYCGDTDLWQISHFFLFSHLVDEPAYPTLSYLFRIRFIQT